MLILPSVVRLAPFLARKLLASVSHSSDNQRLTLVKQNIEDRINKISNLISLDLANPVSTKKAVQANIDRLLRLGLGEQVRDRVPILRSYFFTKLYCTYTLYAHLLG